MTKPRFFATPQDFRAWLATHAASADALLVGFHKVGSGQPGMTWPESVDEALCVGWIDGVRRRIDDQRYSIRFTPRRANSTWSAVNIARYAVLLREGRVTPAGVAAYARRTASESRVYSYEQPATAALSAAEQRAFQRHAPAWRYFEAAPPGYRRTVLHWVCSAKRERTRAERLARLIEACAAGERLR